jgi:Domain of unknown function (DUF4184)
MPFTITHVAAVTPAAWLLRGKVPFSALAIGSMICDVPVFFPWLLAYDKMHSFMGIITHCVPIGVAFYYLFHFVIKRPLATLLPRSMAIRLAPWVDREISFAISQIAVAVVCVTAGACTHVFWDGFTHDAGWGVKLIPELRLEAIRWGDRSMDWYEILQHGSSVVLLPPLVAAAMWWVYRQPVVETAKNRPSINDYVVLGVLCMLVVAILTYTVSVYQIFPYVSLVALLREGVRRVCIALILLVASYCAVLVVNDLRRQPE